MNTFYGHLPSVDYLKFFGAMAIVLNKLHKGKFEARGKEYTMVVYCDSSKAYRLYDSQTQLIVSRDVYFVEPNGKNIDEISIRILKSSPEVEHEQVSTKYDGQFTEYNEDNSEEDFVGFESAEESPQEQKVVKGRGRPRLIRTGGRGRAKKEINVLSLILSLDRYFY